MDPNTTLYAPLHPYTTLYYLYYYVCRNHILSMQKHVLVPFVQKYNSPPVRTKHCTN